MIIYLFIALTSAGIFLALGGPFWLSPIVGSLAVATTIAGLEVMRGE